VDAPALEAALTEVVRRHEVLRTVFAAGEDQPAQVIRPAGAHPLPLLDLRHLSRESADAEARRLAAADARRPFDLARGPLLRCMLLRLGEEDHVLFLTMHHVVSDGWSMNVLTREVSTLYAAYSRGTAEPTPRLPELPVQYADFAAWQRSWLTGDVLDEQIGFWKEKLAGAPPLLEIPTDRPRRVGLSPLAARHGFALSAELSDRLRGLARREGATLFMTLLAGCQVLLAKYSGQEDVVVGTPVAGRTHRETEELIGFFVNMLPLRGDLSGDPTWAELLGRTRETALGAYDHQALPFEKLVEELGVERSLTHSPVFQAVFTLTRAGGAEAPSLGGGVALEPFGGGAGIAKFDLDLVFTDAGEALMGAIVHPAELFDAGTIERMAGHLETVLESMAADPGCRLSGLSLLRGAERTQVLEAWNATTGGYEKALVHERFAEQAARTPTAVSVQWGEEVLGYAELDARSNRLAHHLRGLGVGPETRVGVCLRRTPELMVALLGVLKAGGAYVPLDPTYPPERIAYMLDDAAVPVLLTEQALLARLPEHRAEIVCVDRDAARIAAGGAEPPAVDLSPDNPAYVIYTSGSTGKPKGVVVPHRAMAWFVGAAREVYEITAEDAVLQFASMNFDTSVEEIFPTLLSGGRLVLRTEEVLGSARIFLDACREWGITVLNLPTAYWHELVAELSAGEGADLPPETRIVIVGGERALPERLRAWRERFGGAVRLVNAYGPTETTVVATVADLTAAPDGESASSPLRVVPIGRPLPHARVYVLDMRGEPLPVGVPGELYVGGGGVSRGYLGLPDLTADRFVPDPHGVEAGARLYRTGDRVRWLPDGSLEFLGRVDDQVKVRGFRVEPGEVEAVLHGHPSVEAAVVVVREDVPGDRRIVAYVTPSGDAAPDPAELRAYAGRELPDYMVPSAVVVLEAVPLMPNGKVDRRALPAPMRTGGAHGDGADTPRDEMEAVIAGIFSEVLGVPGVGVRDSFFDLGGHSLLAVQLMSKLEKATGVQVPLASLFEAPTVERLAEAVRRGGGATSLLVPMRRGGSRAPLFLVHPGGGNLMAYAALVKELGAEQPVYGLRSRGIERDEKPNWTMEEMARDYLAAIREVRPSGPYRLGGWSLGGVIAFEMARQLEAEGETVERLVLVDSRSPRLEDPDGSMSRDDLLLVRSFAEDLGVPAESIL
ncbi:MAG: amino acid adenylation domain-containing protein, partial [Gemmatimonadetes bacterium]|nr:amino acid adenylation domain-containing protein [Gemmatimonadota bacterium]